MDLVALHAEISRGDQDAMTAFAGGRGAATPMPLADNERLLLLCFGANGRALGCS